MEFIAPSWLVQSPSPVIRPKRMVIGRQFFFPLEAEPRPAPSLSKDEFPEKDKALQTWCFHYITIWSRDHESPGNETIIQAFWPVEFWIEEKMAIFEDPEN